MEDSVQNMDDDASEAELDLKLENPLDDKIIVTSTEPLEIK